MSGCNGRKHLLCTPNQAAGHHTTPLIPHSRLIHVTVNAVRNVLGYGRVKELGLYGQQWEWQQLVSKCAAKGPDSCQSTGQQTETALRRTCWLTSATCLR